MSHACRLIIALALLPVAVPRLAAQPDRGIEVYGMSGVFSPAISRGYLKPEVGAGQGYFLVRLQGKALW